MRSFKDYLGVLIVLFLSPSLALIGAIIQTETMKDIHPLFHDIDENSLVVFDIDDVIFSTEDHFAHPYGYLKFVELTNQALNNAATSEEKEEIAYKASLSQLLSKRRLVEEDTPQLIYNLQRTGAKVIALTSFPRGKYGAIPRTEIWRIEQLKTFHIDFSTAFPNEKSHEFHEMTRPGLIPPLFENGVLFSHGYSKGEVLTAFLQRTQFYPSKVIFIDDMLYHHASVQSALTELSIPCIGIHYTGANKYFGVCNEPLLRYQFDHLLSTMNWLSDQQIIDLWGQPPCSPQE